MTKNSRVLATILATALQSAALAELLQTHAPAQLQPWVPMLVVILREAAIAVTKTSAPRC